MDNKRKLENEAIVAQALEEEEGRKRLKKANRSADGQQSAVACCRKCDIEQLCSFARTSHSCTGAKKGLSLHEVEAAEGGVVKESLAGVAHQKRSLQRQRKGKGKAAGQIHAVASRSKLHNTCHSSSHNCQQRVQAMKQNS